MNYIKNFEVIVLSVLGGKHNLSKDSEFFLNLLCFEFIKKIIETSNNLLYPTDYENGTIKKFPKKKLTYREIETSIQLLFPKEITDYFIETCKDILYYDIKIFFSKSVTEHLIKKSIVNNIEITKKSIDFLTFITQILIYDIFNSYEKVETSERITNKGLSKVFKEDKQLNELLKVLKVSI